MDCVFCKIVAGEIPATKIYEDENALAFLDIAPVNPGHTLVIPKKHSENLEDIAEADLCSIIKTVKKIGKAVKNSISPAGYNVGLNNGSGSGQLVPHLHFHVMPRQAGDGHKLWSQGKYEEGEAERVAEKIKTSLVS